MARDSAFEQLKEMGIPGGRARAALRRAKGDAMAAAERVFAGEYDDIPSDDEGNSGEEIGTQEASHNRDEEAHPVDDYGEESDPFEDDFSDNDEIEGSPCVSADPYAGVFFSKDRVQKVIEQEHVRVQDAEGRRIVTADEWMSGCPEGNEQSHLFQLHNYLSETEIRCPKSGCNQVLTRKASPFLISDSFSAYTDSLRSQHLICPKCQTAICWACRECNSFDRSSAKSRSDRKRDELFHCANMQGLIVGIGMIIIDQHFETVHSTTALSDSDPTGMKRKASEGDPPLSKKSSVGEIGRAAARGTGYAGNVTEDHSGQQLAAAAQAKKDKEVAVLLKQVQVYLPQASREDGLYSSDHMVHPTTLAHLRRRSGFMNHLLRNDSLLDMSMRGILYRALFDWLEVISAHEALASMIAMPQMRPVQRISVPGQPGQVEVTYEGAASPRELLENIVIQAHAALKGLKAGQPVPVVEADNEAIDNLGARINVREREQARDPKVKEDAELLKTFCERIVTSAARIDWSLVEVKGRAFVDRMKAELPKLPENETRTPAGEAFIGGLSEEDVVKKYEAWASKVRFEYCDMTIAGADSIAYAHAWSEKIVEISHQNLPRRSLAIAKELAILTTNLPTSWHSSIFLRVDEARVDCIKAMIIGPEGTPYQNGCFLFDIFLPQQYNQDSPQVKTMTTNGGLFRYNPNLYQCGKVCLSLLGTWSGPGWVAGQSTLLQVLISIQSLILCEEPYLNEPGWANMAGTPSSKAYSANVRRMCLIDAMGNNLKEPPRPFEDEIRTHFRLKSCAIRKQIDDWKLLDDGLAVRYGKHARTFDQAADALKVLLDELDGVSTAPQTMSTP